MHNEVVHLALERNPNCSRCAMLFECAKILNSCRYVGINSQLRCAYHPRSNTKADTTKTGIVCRTALHTF